MVPTEVSRTRIVIVAIGLLIAILAYAIAERLPAPKATAAQHSDSEREAVEAEIFSADLPGKLEDTLGKAFGGLWFEPSTLQLHVGVTSPASRRQAEATAAQAGLAENVTATPVRFTWEQLKQAQEQWRQRLADLFARGEVMTAPTLNTNSIEIELSETVPPPRRAQLERAAAIDEVPASIDVEPASRFNAVPVAKCAAFKFRNANCEPSIVAGVTIHSELINNVLTDCTAGPLLIRKDRSTDAKATETFMLTAGHCFKYGGGNGKTWSAYNTKAEKNALGKSFEHLMPAPKVPGLDVGVIKIESNYWAPAKDPPVEPHRVEWLQDEKDKESDVVNVAKPAPPVETTQSCMSGQRSGTLCGTVEKVGIQVGIEYTKKRNFYGGRNHPGQTGGR